MESLFFGHSPTGQALGFISPLRYEDIALILNAKQHCLNIGSIKLAIAFCCLLEQGNI
jgi:hypothetical protein